MREYKERKIDQKAKVPKWERNPAVDLAVERSVLYRGKKCLLAQRRGKLKGMSRQLGPRG